MLHLTQEQQDKVAQKISWGALWCRPVEGRLLEGALKKDESIALWRRFCTQSMGDDVFLVRIEGSSEDTYFIMAPHGPAHIKGPLEI